VGKSIQDYDVATAAAREEYIRKLMTIASNIGDTLLDAERDKEIALADAELQKQLTGNQSAYSSAVQAANDAYTTTATSAEASRKSQEQTALTTMNTKLSNELKDKDADIAAAERTYDQTVASLDAQYGSASSNGDTGVEGATRRSAIKTRDAQYYAARDTSWANTLSASINLGTTPWTVKAITAANAEAAHSVSRANAQAAHDAAMLDAMEDWQLSSRDSLTDLLFTEGQSRETYNIATSNVYANWENGVGNLLGDKPEGTGYVPMRGYGEGSVGTWGGAGGGIFTRFEEGEDETTTSGEEVDNVEPPRPTLPSPDSNNSQPLIITVTDSPNDPPGAGEWILERGKVVESCLSGKTLYCVGEWRANDSKSRNFLAEKARIDQLRREFEDIASRHNFLRTILKGDAIEELGGEKVYLENRPGFSPYVITKVIEGRLIKQLWVRSPRPGSMGKVVYTNWLMVPGEISNSDLAHIYENHLDTVEREAATQVLIDVLMQVGGELIALRMAKVIGPGGAAAKSTQILDNVNNFPLEKVLDDAPVGVVLGAGDDYLKWSDELAELFAKELKHAKGGASNTFLGTADEAAEVLAKLIKPIDGFHDIVVHADDITGKFFIKSPNGSIPIEPSTLAKHINSLGLGDDVGIRLISCNGGSCGVTGNGPAYVLQKLINRPIFAHHAPVGIRVDGSLFPYDSVVRDGIHKLIDAGEWTLIR
jgi:hypothetical protein